MKPSTPPTNPTAEMERRAIAFITHGLEFDAPADDIEILAEQFANFAATELADTSARLAEAEKVIDFYEDESRWYRHPVCNAVLHGHRGHVCDKWKLTFNYKGDGNEKATAYRKLHPATEQEAKEK